MHKMFQICLKVVCKFNEFECYAESVFFFIFTYALNAKTKIKSITNYAVQLIMRILL